MDYFLKKTYLYLLFLWMVVGCASPPAMKEEALSFFPSDAELYLQVNVSGFRKLAKDLSKMLPKPLKKNVKTGVNFTGRVALYYQQDLLMAQALGSYPQKMILNKLAKSEQQFTAVDADTFMINDLVTILPNTMPMQLRLRLPQNNQIYLSNHLDQELSRIQQVSSVTLPRLVQEALLSSSNAVLYLPHFSQFIHSIQLEDPLPIPIDGLLLVVTPKGSRYFVQAFAFFGTNETENRRLLAQSRLLVSGLINNKIVENLTRKEHDYGVHFEFSIKHKDLLLVAKRLHAKENKVK